MAENTKSGLTVLDWVVILAGTVVLILLMQRLVQQQHKPKQEPEG